MPHETPYIPYDIFDSAQEILVVLPLWWVKKESLKIQIQDYRLEIQGERILPEIKENLLAVQEECYRGQIHQIIDLPAQVYFDKIHSKLTPENILLIVIPKASIPEQIAITIEE